MIYHRKLHRLFYREQIISKDFLVVTIWKVFVNQHQIEVWSESVAQPVAVRYAWADNPVCNVQNKEGLPLTPFRTDDWPGITINNH